MDELNNNGKFEGFDSVDNDGETSKENINNFQSGYTVTPDGGFYNKPKEEIIQDDVLKSEFKTEENFNKNNYYPTGNYGQKNNYNPGFEEPKNFKKPKTPKRYGAGVVLLASFLAAVIGAGTCAAVLNFNGDTAIKENNNSSPNTSNIGSNVKIDIEETAASVAEAVAKKVTPSVVGIRTTTSVMDFFRGQQEATGEGSGVVYSADGYIITNYHVIADAVKNKNSTKIEVFTDTINDNSYQASVVGYNISNDLAVIKIDAKNLNAINFADSSSLKTGQYVITVGNPGGLEFMDSVTFGIISGLDRVVSTDSNVKLIQTDAAINPGNSGGALVNANGDLVGINSSKIVAEEFEGMGFAIPSNKVKEICDDIIKNENTPEPYVGITISEKYTAEILELCGFPVGAVVLSVAEGSPAYNAGIAKGDIITEFNSIKISEYTIFDDAVRQSVPGKRATIKFYRSGKYYTTEITIGSNS